VDFLDNQLTPSTGTIRMRALLDNAQRQFTPGLFARVRLPGSAEFKATLIDDKAVLTDQDRKYVYIVDKEESAAPRHYAGSSGRRFTHRAAGAEPWR
jgi:multidrug efflux system membrane fusion protein